MAPADRKFAHSCSASEAQRLYLQSINRQLENGSDNQLDHMSGRKELSGIAQQNQE
jgi:hypothetical protein